MPLAPAQRLRFLELKRKRALSGDAQPAAPKPYSQANPAPGAVLSPPLGDTPWYEMGDDYNADQARQAESRGEEFKPQYFSPHIPIPTNPEGMALTGQAVGRGAADLAGGVGDISTMVGTGINQLANMTGVPKAIFGRDLGPFTAAEPIGSDSIANSFSSAAESMGYPIQDPETLDPSSKRVYDMTRFASGAGMGGATAAARAGKATSTIGKAITEPYIEKPVRQIVQDTVAGAGAGLGVNTAQEVSPDSPIAQIAGALLGGGAASSGFNTATAPGRGVYNSSNVELPDGSFAKRKDVDSSSVVMRNVSSNPEEASRKIKASIADSNEGNLPKLTSGIASDDIGLGYAERQARVRDAVPFAEKDQAVRTGVSDSVSDLVDPDADITVPQTMARQSKESQLATARQGSAEALEKVGEAEQRGVNLERDTEALVAPTKGQRGKESVASEALDVETSGALAERTKIKNEGFEAAAGDKLVSAKPLADSVNKVEAEVNRLSLQGSGLPEGFVNRVRDLMKEPDTGLTDPSGRSLDVSGQMNVKDVAKIRGEIGDAISGARRAKNYEMADNLTVLKDDINKMIADIPEFDDAQKYYKDDYAPFFAQGKGKQWRDNKYKSEKGMGGDDPANTAKFFLESTPNAAKDLKKIVDIAPDPKAAEAAVEKYLAADLAHRLGEGASPQVIANWIGDRTDQLDQFPEIKKKFENLQVKAGSKQLEGDSLKIEIKQLSNEFKRAEKNIGETERRINRGTLGALINKDPDKYIKSILGGDDSLQKLDEVLKLVGGNERGKKGLKRAVTEHLLDVVTGTNVKLTDGEGGPISPSKMANYLKGHDKNLAKVYNPSEMNVLQRARRMLSAQGNLERRGIASGSDTAEKTAAKNLGTALETALRVKYGVLKAGGLMKTVRGAATLLPDSHMSRVDRLVSQAMLDPELAVHLLDAKPLTVGKTPWNNKLHGLLGVAAGGREVSDEDDSK